MNIRVDITLMAFPLFGNLTCDSEEHDPVLFGVVLAT